ncbi:hypothetical protein TWF694_006459 [Orbilia ellipsospora]|uniref:Uncharacterized protein n=1 Tax=Orbilia ellipsospora TaxID=2528407 RepID=A0AAV9XK99_9PEZI
MSSTQTPSPTLTTIPSATGSSTTPWISSKYGIIIAAAVGGFFILVSATLVFIGLRILLRERRKRDMQLELERQRRSSVSTDSTDRTAVEVPMASSKAFQV